MSEPGQKRTFSSRQTRGTSPFLKASHAAIRESSFFYLVSAAAVNMLGMTNRVRLIDLSR
jgi:hypothetical protein